MEKSKIKTFAEQLTNAPTKVTMNNEQFFIGYFQTTKNSMELEKENKWTFIENNNNINYKAENDDKFATILCGDEIIQILYPV
jgi:hypothetical protein